MPEIPDIYPTIQPTKTSIGKWAPIATRDIAKAIPVIKKAANHIVFFTMFFGINANIKTVKTVKIVIECPEGKLLVEPGSIFPIITKLSVFKADAGRGTEKNSFKIFENIAENIDAEINASQNFGYFKNKTVNKERQIVASPIWVKLY